MPGVQGIDQGKKWESETACLSAIFSESVDCQINQGDNFILNVFPRRVELRNLEHGRQPYGYGAVFEVEDRWCPGHINKYESPLNAIHNQQVVTAKRGIIGGFSRKSATRMKKTIEDNLDDLKMFQTLTYPDEVFDGMTYEDRVKFTQAHLKRFNERLKYHNWFGFWRREFVSRKSGGLRGEVLPHYHCMLNNHGITNYNYVSKGQEVARWWVDTMKLDDLTAYHKALKVNSNYNHHGSRGNAFELLDNKGAVSRYVGKYMSKADQELIPDGVSIGRSWGRVGKVTQAVPVSIYLTKREMVRFTRICRGLYRSTAKNVRKKYLSDHRVGAFIFMLAENAKRCLEYLRDVAFDDSQGQTFVDVPF